MRVFWMMMIALCLSAGCSTQQYGQCDAPADHLEVLFKPKITGHPFSHSFCVVCNTEISPEDYGDWALQMGASSVPNDPSDPCLYVYPSTESNIDSLAECQSLVCDGGAEYSDMASDSNGNFDLAPLLNGAALEFNEEWVLTGQGQTLQSQVSESAELAVPTS